MPTELRLPPLADTVTSVKLAAWLKAEGEAVAAGEPLVEVETDKTNVEIEAPAGGVVSKIHVPAGTEGLETGALLAVIDEGAGAAADTGATAEAAASEPAVEPEAAPTELEGGQERDRVAAGAAHGGRRGSGSQGDQGDRAQRSHRQGRRRACTRRTGAARPGRTEAPGVCPGAAAAGRPRGRLPRGAALGHAARDRGKAAGGQADDSALLSERRLRYGRRACGSARGSTSGSRTSDLR